ncbi:hypothetical protein A2U01_0088147, partial [Trifolium medium]|nr:hypothetical protein [Trifolium medium]
GSPRELYVADYGRSQQSNHHRFSDTHQHLPHASKGHRRRQQGVHPPLLDSRKEVGCVSAQHHEGVVSKQGHDVAEQQKQHEGI